MAVWTAQKVAAVGVPLDAAPRLTTVTSVSLLALNKDRVSLCSPGCLKTHSENQAGLKLTEICLLCWV